LYGYPLASIFSKDPKEFQKLLSIKINDAQTSILGELDICSQKDAKTPQSFNLNNKLYRDDFERRRPKDVVLGLDFKSPL